MNKVNIIKSEADELLKKLIDKFELEVKEENEVFHIIIKTEEGASIVIGRHGETIRALQKILEVILYKKFSEPINILVNVNDYREKQKEKLENLANQLAKKTEESRQPKYLRGLTSYERKIIHEYITKNYPHLTSYSIGEGKGRELVINLKSEQPKEKKSV